MPVQQENLPCSCLPHPSAHTCSAPHVCHPLISPPPQSAETAELRSKLRKAQEAANNEKQLRLALEQQRVALEQQRHAMEQQLAAADSARRQAEAALEAARKEAKEAAARAAQPDLPGLAPKPMLPKALQAFAKLVGGEDPSAHSSHNHATASMDASDSDAESDSEGGAEGASVGTPLGATAALGGELRWGAALGLESRGWVLGVLMARDVAGSACMGLHALHAWCGVFTIAWLSTSPDSHPAPILNPSQAPSPTAGGARARASCGPLPTSSEIRSGGAAQCWPSPNHR